MYTSRGITVDAWAKIEPDCHLEHYITGDDMQIEFGIETGVLHLVITDEMVDRLVAVFTDVQATFRALDAEAEREELTSSLADPASSG